MGQPQNRRNIATPRARTSCFACSQTSAVVESSPLCTLHSSACPLNARSFKMGPIKELALLEPLVDNCDPEQVISNAAPLINIDIYTVRKEDLDFTASFSLEINKDETLHALVAFFNVEFSKTHTKLWFSTGPKSKSTHWKQTVFYLRTPLPVKNNDVIKGKISVKRNDKNPRDLDIELWAGNGKLPKEPQSYRLR